MIITFKNSRTGKHTRISCDHCDTPMIYQDECGEMILHFRCIHNGNEDAMLKATTEGPGYPTGGVDTTESFNSYYNVIKGKKTDIYDIRWMALGLGDVMYITDGKKCVED